MAVREPDPRILAAEDALLRYNRDDAWLLAFDRTYRERVDDLTQPPIGNYDGVQVQQERSNPTARRGEALATLSVEATAQRLRRVLAVRAAMDAMGKDDVQRKWAMALDYRYMRSWTIHKIAETIPPERGHPCHGVSEDTVARYIQKGLEIVADMLSAE